MKLIDIVGARPQFIKVAPVLKAIEGYNEERPDEFINEILVHTGQHYDFEMSQVFFNELGLKDPQYHLGVGSGSHGYQTGEMLKRIEDILTKESPDVVMVYGDTNSTLAGALAATKLHIPVAHVEAGLRSFNRKMPEEINRVVTDHVSDFLFCPTETAVHNLQREGFGNVLGQGQLFSLSSGPAPITSTPLVVNTGDVMYDAVLLYGELAKEQSRILQKLNLEPREYALVTVHRAENTDNPFRLRAIFQGLDAIVRSGLTVVLPVHPRTQKYVQAYGIEARGIRTIEPASYLDMLVLEENARVILTDSGGVQKEAFFFHVPCVTLREETEWVETVEAGWNAVVGADPIKIVDAVDSFKGRDYQSDLYGDGRAAEKIVRILS